MCKRLVQYIILVIRFSKFITDKKDLMFEILYRFILKYLSIHTRNYI